MKNNFTVAIIGAMDCEIEYLLKRIKNIEIIDSGAFLIYIGTILNSKIVLTKSGVGKVNMACCAQYIIDKFTPDYIINTGVAGGISPELNVGDIVIADKLVQHDFDATAVGYTKGNICNRSERNVPTIFYTDKKLIELAMHICSSNFHVGLVATGDTFVADYSKKTDIKNTFSALAIEMEGAALAQVATKNSVPFLVLRVISDLADGSNIEFQDKFEINMARVAASVVEEIMRNI